jgi:hypothetical protein
VFRLLKLRPPNGWHSVLWELVIVTLGVLIALAAQNWAEQRTWRAKAVKAKAALKQELASHYFWSLEWRLVQPCILAQIDRLQQRVILSGSHLDPAPVYSERDFAGYVLRLPSKDYQSSVWSATISDGVSSHLEPEVRQELGAHYAQAHTMVNLTARNDEDNRRLLSLSRPIPIDPMVRHSLLQTLDELRGRAAFMDLQSGQLIDHIENLEMTPSVSQARAEVTRWGTYRFCSTHRLPVRSFKEAATPVSN